MNAVKIKIKSTGIVRWIDGLGRIVIPREIRRQISPRLEDGTPLELFVAVVDDKKGVLAIPYSPSVEYQQSLNSIKNLVIACSSYHITNSKQAKFQS